MLKRLCGDQTTYHKVRDHYVFGFHLTQLLEFSKTTLQAAKYFREKARRCSTNWRGPEFTWENLSPGGLVGVEKLISKDFQLNEIGQSTFRFT